MSKRFRASYQIAIGFVLIVLLAVYGYRYANDLLLGGSFAPLQPGKVNIVGVDTSKGYAIVVSNGIAKLLMGDPQQFKAGQMDEKSLEADDSPKKPIPIKEMLQGMAGDGVALGYFVEKLNDINENAEEWPIDAPVWKAEDLEKAIKGDRGLETKLVRDLNMQLDGTPLNHVSMAAFSNGIIVDAPIPLKVMLKGRSQTILARVKRPYRPSFISRIESKLRKSFFNEQTVANEYADAMKGLESGVTAKENIRNSLGKYWAPETVKRLAEQPQATLDTITIAVNEAQITGARYEATDTPNGKIYKLVISLTNEGRKRLYQFSRDRVGSQLLLTVNGVAIAAPFISHSLSGGEVEITHLLDESVVQDAVETINLMRAKKE